MTSNQNFVKYSHVSLKSDRSWFVRLCSIYIIGIVEKYKTKFTGKNMMKKKNSRHKRNFHNRNNTTTITIFFMYLFICYYP